MYSFDVSEKDFEEKVIQASYQQPVVIDFWASWCGPCKILKPILEKFAKQYEGKFLLAKVDSDANQTLSQQFGVRGIPNVKAVYKGAIVSEFSGALPESAVKEFLDNIIPSPSDELVAEALQAMSTHQIEDAKEKLTKALELNAENPAAHKALMEIALKENDLEGARKHLDNIPTAEQLDEDTKMLIEKLTLAENVKDLPGEQELLHRIESDPENLQPRLDLANLYISQKKYQSAMDRLFEVLQKDKNYADDQARKNLLSLFNLLTDKPDLVRAARRRLASILN